MPSHDQDLAHASMDISVQLTCGQGQHVRSVQHEENQADIQDGVHVSPPPKVEFVSVLIPRPRVVVVSPFFFGPGEKLRTVERGKTARVQPECCGFFFFNKTTLRSEGALGGNKV